jgi:biotin transport system substrate-specific component
MPLKKMIGAAFFAAIISVLSQFVIPIGAVPHTLQVLAAVLAGVVLGPFYGAVSVVVWIFLGAFGLPVFAMGQSGLGVVFGPLGGFLMGFVVEAFVCGYCHPEKSWIRAILIGLASIALVYAIGIAGFMAAFKWLLNKPMTLTQAFTVCAVPFVPFDTVKMFLGILLGSRISRALVKAGLDVR